MTADKSGAIDVYLSGPDFGQVPEALRPMIQALFWAAVINGSTSEADTLPVSV